MSPRARFIVLSLLYAAALFVAQQWLPASALHGGWLRFTVAAIAVMLAAVGVPWKRKLLFAGATASFTVALAFIVNSSGLGRAADVLSSAGAPDATNLQLAAFALVQLLFLGLPVAALALFVGRRPSILWTAPTPHASRTTSRARRMKA